MGLITRASLPTEFVDMTSALMLKQPQPQFIYAQFWKMALAASLSAPGSLGITPQRAIQSSGDMVPSFDSNKLMFADPVFSEAMVNVPELGKSPGHTVRVNRPYFASTTYTEAAREVVAGASINTTAVDIANEQVAVTLKRYAGPYDQANSRVAPYGLERFDSSMALHSLVNLVGVHLQRDFDATIDGFLASLLDLGSVQVMPTGFTVDNDITVALAAQMDFDTLARAEATLDAANIPVFPNGRRVCLLHPTQLQQLKNDPQFARYAEFHPPVNPVLAQSYFRTIGGLDIFKSTTVPTSTNGSSVTVYHGQAFGPGVVGSGIGELPRVAFSTDDNFGEQAKVIWLLYGGFRLFDNRFVVAIHTG